LIILLSFTVGKAQQAIDTCKVLSTDLQGRYIGKCKHGLANGKGIAIGKDKYTGEFRKGYPDGKGTYEWYDGSVYIGEWKKGKRFGIGTYTYKLNGINKSIHGVWKNDKYIGKEEHKPMVLVNKYVDSYEFQNLGGTYNRVLIQFIQNGTYNKSISNVMMTSTSGTLTNRDYLTGYDNVSFPVTITVRYDTFNKMGTWTYNCNFEFIIYDEGDWIVTLKN
jgi:hypothetical protein